MEDAERLADRFEAARPRLQRIALRMLGSAAESDDALQESWLRISRGPLRMLRISKAGSRPSSRAFAWTR